MHRDILSDRIRLVDTRSSGQAPGKWGFLFFSDIPAFDPGDFPNIPLYSGLILGGVYKDFNINLALLGFVLVNT